MSLNFSEFEKWVSIHDKGILIIICLGVFFGLVRLVNFFSSLRGLKQLAKSADQDGHVPSTAWGKFVLTSYTYFSLYTTLIGCVLFVGASIWLLVTKGFVLPAVEALLFFGAGAVFMGIVISRKRKVDQ